MTNIGRLTATVGLDATAYRQGVRQVREGNAAVTKSSGAASRQVDQLGQSAGKTGASLKNVGENLRGLGLALSALSAPIVGFAAVGVRVFGQFEQNMAQVRGITGATGVEFVALTEIAREMGRTTVFTATESSEALRFMGMAGLSAQDSIEALPHLLNLAAAGALDLGTAADIATNIMTPFGMLLCGTIGGLLISPTIIVVIIGLIEGILYLTKQDDEFEQKYVVEQKSWF